ncbi:MAG: hypothetical protein OXF56_20470, partial [Rhodobacteraceae bacterium]|nr:hypothetical protein [Paracoccaceae bacterium]
RSLAPATMARFFESRRQAGPLLILTWGRARNRRRILPARVSLDVCALNTIANPNALLTTTRADSFVTSPQSFTISKSG